MKVEKVRLRSLEFLEAILKGLLKGSRLVLEDDLITSMSKHCLLTDKLTKFYRLVYWEGQSSWGWEYLLFKQRMWEIQDRKMITKEGLDWRVSDRMSKNDIFTTRF